MFVSSKRSRLLLGSFPSEVVYHIKYYPQGTANLNRTVLESSDKTNPNLARVLDVNPSLFLAREVQPPLIYSRGDGRLNNNTQSQTHLQLFHLRFVSPSFFLPRSSSFFMLESCEYRGSRGGLTDLGQPIAAALPDGVPPGSVGFRVFKSSRRSTCESRFR